MDYILNGQAHGEVAEMVLNGDLGLRRPYFNERGKRCCDVLTGRSKEITTRDPVTNAEKIRVVPEREQVFISDLLANGIFNPVFNATTLRKEQWIRLDEATLRAARFRLRAWADLAAANSYGGFNGMATMVLEHEIINDPGEAVVDMDGLTPGRTDSPVLQLQGVPLPITHVDYNFSSRRLAVSKANRLPLDLAATMGEVGGRRIAESIEKTTIGVVQGVQYGPGVNTPPVGYSSQVYGYGNFPNRLIYSAAGRAPTQPGWSPSWVLQDVLAMKDALFANKFYGPYVIYHSNDWDQYLDNDYILTGGNVATQTLRERLKKIEQVSDVRRLDFMFSKSPNAAGKQFQPFDTLYPFSMFMVQMTPDVAQAVNGMDITTVQHEEKGGMQLCFRVMAIQVPRLRSDFYGNCGILHATFTQTG
jgi:hypothetical protein